MKTLALSFIFLLCLSTQLSATIKEDIIKGILVKRFSNFIEWPSNQKEKFVIGIYGESTLIDQWESLYDDEKIKNKNVAIVALDASNIDHYISKLDILFIQTAKKNKLQSIINLASQYNILTVGSKKKYQNSGVILSFFKQAEKIKFSVNQTRLMNSNIKISYKLLKLANIVSPMEGSHVRH